MPLGAADYLAIAERFSIIIIEDVPRLDASKYNEARRFVTMIDAFYESSVLERLVISAEVPLSELFVEFEATVETNDGDEETTVNDGPCSSGVTRESVLYYCNFLPFQSTNSSVNPPSYF